MELRVEGGAIVAEEMAKSDAALVESEVGSEGGEGAENRRGAEFRAEGEEVALRNSQLERAEVVEGLVGYFRLELPFSEAGEAEDEALPGGGFGWN